MSEVSTPPNHFPCYFRFSSEGNHSAQLTPEGLRALSREGGLFTYRRRLFLHHLCLLLEVCMHIFIESFIYISCCSN